MDLKLLQKNVVEIFGVSVDCMTFWENNKSEPQIQYYPCILEFLGFVELNLIHLQSGVNLRLIDF